MRPKPVKLTPHQRAGYFRDQTDGRVWRRTEYRILYADTDRSGAVYHSNHLRFFELGRADLMRDLGRPYRAIEESGYIYPIVQTGVNYYQVLEYDEPIWILTRPGQLQRVKATFHYIIIRPDDAQPAADGFTVHCALNVNRQPAAVDEKTAGVWRDFPQ